MNAEQQRLRDACDGKVSWRKWGPYLSERQWGTVREDYSDDGNAWDYFTHDQARSRAYRWGEDGLAGVSDDKQRLCFALALWNGVDPILKERLFGLSNSEGNHGEDVKEYYFYLDSTPTHSYMKYLYKYPQRAFPYDDLVNGNHQRTRKDFEYELIDTGVFAEDRYFDVFVEYAKESAEELLIQVTVYNRGPEPAALHVLPTLWFRNTWTGETEEKRPGLRVENSLGGESATVVRTSHAELGECFWYLQGSVPVLSTENETNLERIFGRPNLYEYVKDGINSYVVEGKKEAVNPEGAGTKAAAHYQVVVEPGGVQVMRMRLGRDARSGQEPGQMFGDGFAAILDARKHEADEFFGELVPASTSEDACRVFRQAMAGMLWSKQYFYFDLDKWLCEHGADPMVAMAPRSLRNREWFHMFNDDVISMPDKWEYPWYAAWDLAFHCVALGVVDLDFAKKQLHLMLGELYLHPNGQIPAYEWNFSDVNPPVHAWATWWVFNLERERHGQGDIEFLKQAFNKLLLNFTWWVNRKDRAGRNVFEGGFLGLDNIGVFDRSAPLPTGGCLEQADGTAWMALFSQNMLQIALELALHDPSYEDMALKFVEHFFWIASAMNRMGDRGDKMWDEEDGFFYDLLRCPDGRFTRLKVRSMVGLLPLCATTVFPGEISERFPRLMERIRRRLDKMPELRNTVPNIDRLGVKHRCCLALLDDNKLRRVLARLLDESEFFSPYGIRSVSRQHAEHPYVFHTGGEEYKVGYMPAESDSGMFGGNSNWRGPVWLPVNFLILRALLNFYLYYGDSFKVECPTGSGKLLTLFEVVRELRHRLTKIFLRDGKGKRPVFGDTTKFQTDPHWRDHLLFYEYFHGDNGAGLGASHQTGWTGLIGAMIHILEHLDSADLLERGYWGIRKK